MLSWGALTLDPSSYEISYNRTPIHLTPKEFALMEALLRYGRRVLSRTAIIDQIWHWQEAPEDNTIKSYIKTYIKTFHGLGYRLKAME